MTSTLTSSLSESEIKQMEQRIEDARDERNKFAEKVFQLICGFYGVEPEKVTQHARNRDLVIARQLFHYYMSQYTDMPLKKIGSLTKHDHATVIYSKRRILDALRYDTTLRNDMKVLDKYVKDIVENG